MKYSPLFTAVCSKAGKFGLRKIGILELPFYAMGIKFPQEVKESDTNFFTDISVLKASQYCKQRPVVIFPEGTKTNGRGILNFENDITKMLLHTKTSLHAIRFNYDFEYTSPYNITDIIGLKSMVKLLTQVRNSMTAQYYFNLDEKIKGIPDFEAQY